MSNKLKRMASEILAIEQDLTNRHLRCDDFELHTFEQLWSSTALGFGGIGGQAMTSARTYVLIPYDEDKKCFVYFAGRFAYAVPYSEKLMDDVCRQNMASVMQSGKYVRK